VELVALGVGSDLERGDGLLAADEECALNDAVVGLAEDVAAAEQEFAGGFEALEETT